MERRVSARIETELYIGVVGVDEAPVLRRGNFSSTGVYFEIDRPIGEVGSLQRLHLLSYDRSIELRVVARMARRVQIDDLHHRARPVTGAGLQFFPGNEHERATLVRLLRAVIKHQVARDLEVDHGYETSIGDNNAASTVQLSVHRMLLDTSHPLEVGELVEFDIRPGRGAAGVPFSGKVTRVAPRVQPDGSETYRVEVSIGEERADAGTRSQRLHDASLSFNDTIDRAFTDLLAAESDERPHLDDDLMGQLARIPLTSLLPLFEMERMSGELKLSDGGLSRAQVFLRDGRVIDAVADPARPHVSARQLLGELMRWRDGTFELTLGAVERPDRIETPTTVLMLDLAREHDERQRSEH